jgi:hypothetical protein
MRTTIELSDRTYTRLRAKALERGMRGFSPIVEEALERLLEQDDDIQSAVLAAEGAWGELDDVPPPVPSGLASVAGALSDWDEIDEVVEEIYSARRTSRDRAAPDLG